MKYAMILSSLAAPVMAQNYDLRATDSVPTRATLSETILDRDLEYFDGGISRYATNGTYAWTYGANNGGGVHEGVHDFKDNGVVCITYHTGARRCDMFVLSNDRLTLLTNDGQRYPVRKIE